MKTPAAPVRWMITGLTITERFGVPAGPDGDSITVTFTRNNREATAPPSLLPLVDDLGKLIQPELLDAILVRHSTTLANPTAPGA